MKKATLFVFFSRLCIKHFGVVTCKRTSRFTKVSSQNHDSLLLKQGSRFLLDLSTISAKDLQNLTGKKMNFFDRLAFKASQRKLKKSIDADGTITSKKINKFFSKRFGPHEGFHALGFILDFSLAFIGVLYRICDE